MRDWRKIAGYLIIGIGVIAYGIDVGDRFGLFGEQVSAGFSPSYRGILVSRKVFRNEEVLLDGHDYENCDFYNVTFVYNGTTPIQAGNSSIFGSMQFKTKNPIVNATLIMTIGFNLIKPDVKFTLVPGTNVSRGQNVYDPPKNVP